MRLDLVAVRIPVEHRLGDQFQIGGTGCLVTLGADFQTFMQLAADRILDFARGEHRRHGLPEIAEAGVDPADVVAVKADGLARAFLVQPVEPLRGDRGEHLGIEIRGEEIAKENMRKGQGKAIGGADARYGVVDQFFGQATGLDLRDRGHFSP
jgi:hypothetical protein